jgi:Tfp pilus assembly protein PilE
MHRHLPWMMVVILTALALSCQSYTKGLQESVTRADETAAIAALRTIATAQQTYTVSHEGSYGSFGELVQSGYLDSRFNADKPKIKGYVLAMFFTSAPHLANASYTVNADPEPPQVGRHFYIDSSSGLIHVNASGPAGASDPTLDQ